MDGFQRTTLVEVDHILQQRYPDSLPDYKEKRDANNKIIETLWMNVNATHRMEVKNVFDGGLWYREVPLEQGALNEIR